MNYSCVSLSVMDEKENAIAIFRKYDKVALPVIDSDEFLVGIVTIDDVMEFLVTGASAVQVGTASFAEPRSSTRLLDALPAALAEAGVTRVVDLVGTLRLPAAPPAAPSPQAR